MKLHGVHRVQIVDYVLQSHPAEEEKRGFSCEVTSLLATSTLHQLGISTTCREDVAVQNSPCIALLSVRKSRCDHLPSAATVQLLAIVLQFAKHAKYNICTTYNSQYGANEYIVV